MNTPIKKILQSAFALSLLSSQLAFAATSTWTGTTSALMNLAGNWSPAGIPDSDSSTILIFPSTL